MFSRCRLKPRVPALAPAAVAVVASCSSGDGDMSPVISHTDDAAESKCSARAAIWRWTVETPSCGRHGSRHASSTQPSVWLLPLPCRPTATRQNGSLTFRYTGAGVA
jgi:hypothetical protein